jgi:hypothetical protein
MDDEDTNGKYNELVAEIEPFDTLHERIQDDPDPAVRLAGIEAVLDLRPDDRLDLLWLAVSSEENADNRLAVVSILEQIVADGHGDMQPIQELLAAAAEDSDPRVADLSNLILHEQFGEPRAQLAVDEAAEATETDQTPAADFEVAVDTEAETVDVIRDLAVLDPDPDARLSGIEAIVHQDESVLEVLREAALYDYVPDNRLAAVSQLEQLLVNEPGFREPILELMEDTLRDLDPRVADLSALIIQENEQ